MSYDEMSPGRPSPREEYLALHKKLETMLLPARLEYLNGLTESERAVLMAGKEEDRAARTDETFTTLINLPGGLKKSTGQATTRTQPDLEHVGPGDTLED